MNKSEIVNIQDLCRICLKENIKMYSLECCMKEHVTIRDIVEMLMSVKVTMLKYIQATF